MEKENKEKIVAMNPIILEARYCDRDNVLEIGIDEAGRGPLWGPLMAACVVWPNESEWTDDHRETVKSIRDSKKVSAKKRLYLYDRIKKQAIAYGIGVVSASEIDANGASWANQTVFRRAVEALNVDFGIQERRYIVDGTLNFPMIGSYEHCINVVDGDAWYIHVAAASILAKVDHDAWVTQWCDANPDLAEKYCLASSKGYGTANHRAAIKAFGLLDEHRRLYCRNIMPELVSLFPERNAPKMSKGSGGKKRVVEYDFVNDD
jgi:ribonuclease HII